MIDARARVDGLAEANPAAAALAGLLSPAVRSEPELVRRMRLLLPAADVGAEADLWASDLAASATPNGLVFDPDVARLLRRELAAGSDVARRDRALALIAASHRGEHWSLRLEERINALEVTGGALDEQENLLLAAVGQLAAEKSREPADRVGLARWLLGLWSRLPDRVRPTDAAFAAQACAGLHLDRRPPLAAGDAPVGSRDTWLPWLLAAAAGSGGRTGVGVRLADGRLELNVAAPGAATLELPATTPLVIDIDGEAVDGPIHHRVEFARGTPVAVPLSLDEARVTTLDGRRYTVRRKGTRPAGGYDFASVRAGLRPCLARADVVREVVGAVTASSRRPWWVVLSGAPGVGKSVVLGDVLDELAARGTVVLQHCYGVRPEWDAPDRVAASLIAQLQAAVPERSWVPPAGAESAKETWTWALASLSDAAHPDVVVAVDGMPGHGPDDVRDWLWASPFASQPPDGVSYLATARAGSGVGHWLESGDPWVHRPLDDSGGEAVCTAMVDHAAGTLRAAFGAPAPDPDQRAALADLAGGNPGRLAGIIAWLADQPAGLARIEEIPVLLTARLDEVWQRHQSALDSMWFTTSAVALDGCTVEDIHQASDARREPLADNLATLAAAGLLRLDGDPALPGTPVGPQHPSLAAELGSRWGEDTISAAHGAHAAAVPLDLDAASRYQIASAVRHHLGAGSPEAAATLVRETEFLERRAREGGLAALGDDLARAAEASPDPEIDRLQRALANVGAAALTEPERFGDILVNEVRRLGGFLEPTWPLALSLHRVIEPAGGSPASDTPVTDRESAVAAARSLLRAARYPPSGIRLPGAEAGVVAGLGSGLEVEVGDQLRYRRDRRRYWTSLPLAQEATALVVDEGLVAAGLADGAVVAADPTDAVPERTLVGHAGPVTGALAGKDGSLVTASADGTARVWTMPSGRLRFVYRRHRGPICAIAPYDDAVVTGDEAGGIRLWRLPHGQDLTVLPGQRAAVTALVQWGPETLLSAGLDGALWRWDLGDGAHAALRRGGAPVQAMALVTPALLATWEAGGVLRWWDPTTLAELRAIRPAEVVEPVRQLVARPGSGDVAVVHAAGVTTFPAPTSGGDDGERPWLGALAVSADGARVAWGEGEGSREALATAGEARSVSTVRAPRLVAYAGDDLAAVPDGVGDGIFWLGDRPVRLPVAGPVSALRALTGGSVAGTLTAAFADGTVRRWSGGEWERPLATGIEPGMVQVTEAGRSLEFPAARGEPVSAVGLTPSGTWLVAASGARLVRSAESGEQPLSPERVVEQVADHPAPITGLAVLGGTAIGPSECVVTACEDGMLRLWDVGRGTLLGAAVADPGVVALAAGGETVAARTRDGAVWVLRAEPPYPTAAPPTITPPGPDGPAEALGTLEAPRDMELRAIGRRTSDPDRIERPPWVEIDDIRVPVGPDGRLAVPRRLQAGHPVTLGLPAPADGADPHGELVVTCWQPGGIEQESTVRVRSEPYEQDNIA